MNDNVINFDFRNITMDIAFHFQKKISLKQRKLLKQFIQNLFNHNHREADSVNFIFCSDEYLLQINKDFLDHDYYTDIITFNLAEPKGPISGEIYISVDRIRENAKSLQVSITLELHRVIFHGILHLCGFNDKTQKTKAVMTNQEDLALRNYGLL